NRALIGGQRDLRICSKLVAVLADNLIVCVADSCLDDLCHGGTSIHALEVGHRHLAGTKSIDPDTIFQLVQSGIDLGVKFGSRNDDLELTLEAFGERFGNLHRTHFSLLALASHRLTIEPRAPVVSEYGRTRNIKSRWPRGAGGGTRTPTT